MIIWGSKSKQAQIGSGVFFCPVCRAKSAYSHIQVSRYFTLYFIPLFPTSTLGKFIRCNGCSKELPETALTLTQEDLDRINQLWVCPACNNKNSSAEEKCLACGLGRYSKPPPIPTASSSTVPPAIPTVPPRIVPPPVPQPSTRSTQTPPQPSRQRKTFFNPLTITITAVIVLFAGLFIWRVNGFLQWQKQPHPSTGVEQFHSASKNINASGPGASGNSTSAIEFANKMSLVMEEIRDTAFEHASEKSILDKKDGFKTYCDLTPGQCVFLVHVPELRRFDSKAQDDLAEAAWRTAKVILEDAHLESSNIKLAVGIQGLISYERVMYGRIQLGITNNPTKPTVESGFGCERTLYSWFKPAPGKNPKTNQIEQTTSRRQSSTPLERTKLAAEKGDAKEQLKLAVMYLQGEQVPQDPDKAIALGKKAAEQGLVDAQVFMAGLYEAGVGVKRDGKEAVRWFQKASDQGDSEAQSHLSSAYANGFGVKKDTSESLRWARKSAEGGFAPEQFALGNRLLKEDSSNDDLKEAMSWFRKAAEQGHAAAQYNIGKAYGAGQGLPVDNVESFKWLYIAGAQGMEVAEPARAVREKLSPQDLTKSIYEILEMANAGSESAQLALGLSYFEGISGPPNQVEVAKWYRKAAEQGNSRAQSYLGFCYLKGNGVEKNEKEAFQWFRKSAQAGYGQAQGNLALCYFEGLGTKTNLSEGVKWMRLAAAQEYPEAQMELGMIYAEGKATSKDPIEAYKWLSIGLTNQTNPNALKDLNRMRTKMKPSDVTEADRRIKEYLEAHPLRYPEAQTDAAINDSKLRSFRSRFLNRSLTRDEAELVF